MTSDFDKYQLPALITETSPGTYPSKEDMDHLTRNCGWNRCLSCPVYKDGVRFSRRSIEEVKKDVQRARVIYDLPRENAAEQGAPGRLDCQDAASLILQVGTAIRLIRSKLMP